MKKSLLIHAAWAVIAVITFVIGAKNFAGEATSDSSDPEARSGARYADRSQANGSHGSRLSRKASRTNRASSDTLTSHTGKVNLTESGIKSLGHLIKTSSDPIERRIAFSKLLEGLTAENAMLMREQIEHMSSNTPEWREFHYAWGGLAGLTAVEFGAESKKMDMAACFSGWASKDPGAAMTWFDSQPDDKKNRDDLKWGAVYGLANTDPALATSFVTARMQLLDKDAGKMMNLVAGAVLRSGSVLDAARWTQSLAEGPLRAAAVSRVARDYAQHDPEKATAWLESLSEGSGQTRALDVAYSTWASRDADAVFSKIKRMNDSPARDAAVSGYTRRLAYRDPVAAINLANTISNPKSRDETLLRYGRIYIQRDREAASRWLSNSNLAPALQKRIQASVKRK